MSVEATHTTSLTTSAAIVEHPVVTSSMLSSALAPNSTLMKPKMSSSSNMPMPTNSQVLAGDAGAFGISVSYTLLVSVYIKGYNELMFHLYVKGGPVRTHWCSWAFCFCLGSFENGS
jgi:hypothetical protein